MKVDRRPPTCNELARSSREIAYVFLLPVALGPTTIADRLVNVGYPLLDLVAIIPALLLFRITSAFRGGRVWRVWAALLVGIFCSMGGDVAVAVPQRAERLFPRDAQGSGATQGA